MLLYDLRYSNYYLISVLIFEKKKLLMKINIINYCMIIKGNYNLYL